MLRQYGAESTDKLIVVVTDHIKRLLTKDEMLSRISTGRFILLLSGIPSSEDAHTAADQIRSAIASSVTVNDVEYTTMSSSIGISLYARKEGKSADLLIKEACRSMYKAMLEGKNQITFFDALQNKSILKENERRSELKTALREQQSTLFYQPKVNRVTGELIGLEVLIRWIHPVRGIVPPSSFSSTPMSRRSRRSSTTESSTRPSRRWSGGSNPASPYP